MLRFLYFDFKSECFARDILQKTLSQTLAPRIIRASSRNPNQGRWKGKGRERRREGRREKKKREKEKEEELPRENSSLPEEKSSFLKDTFFSLWALGALGVAAGPLSLVPSRHPQGPKGPKGKESVF